MKTEQLEKFLIKDCYELRLEDGLLYSTIFDEELDPIEVLFDREGCIEINTENLKYITLSTTQLKKLITLIKKAEKIYKNQEDLIDEI
jgi:hypothetical protein